MSLQIGTRYNLKRVNLGMYPDNTPVVDLEEVWNAFVGEENLIMVSRPNSLHEFVTHMFVADSFAERGTPFGALVIPCIPGARQDRVKWEGDWLFTLKSVAKMVNERNFKRVVTIDPHSIATTALINRCLVPELNVRYMMSRERNATVDDYAGIIAPDIGAEKRAANVAKQFGIPVVQAVKTRDPATNKLSGFKVLEPLKTGKRYLVVDDLCDAGGTFVGLAKAIRADYDVTLDLFVTHGLFTKGTSTLLQEYERIFATDSIEINNERVTTLPITEGLSIYAA